MKLKACSLRIALSVFTPVCALAQAGDPRPSSATTTLGESKVTITVSGGERVINANGLPNHSTGRFPGRGNPNKSSAQTYNFHVPTDPKAADKPTTANGAWFGVTPEFPQGSYHYFITDEFPQLARFWRQPGCQFHETRPGAWRARWIWSGRGPKRFGAPPPRPTGP